MAFSRRCIRHASVRSIECRLRIDSQESPDVTVVTINLIKIGPCQFHGRDSSGGQIGQVIRGGAVDQRHGFLLQHSRYEIAFLVSVWGVG